MTDSGLDSEPDHEHLEPGSSRPSATNRADVNREARRLRLHFLQSNDLDAFRRLILLLEAPLLPVAHSLTRELGLALPATQLLADHLAEVFTDLRNPAVDEPDVLGAAEAAMRRLAAQRLESLRAATARGEPRPDLLPVDAHGHVRALAGSRQVGDHFLVVVNHAFHDLSTDDRLLLLAADVDLVPPGEIARRTGLREPMALRRIRKARVRLAAAIAAHAVTMTNTDGSPSEQTYGMSRLADLAYELAKASLMQVPNIQRRIQCVVEPRETPLVARELRHLVRHRETAPAPVDLTGVPSEAPSPSEALRAAASCLRVLERLEGATPRHALCISQIHMFRRHPDRAETQLRALLARPLPAEMRVHGQVNLMLALTKQDKHIEAISLGEQILQDQPNNWQLLFNLAVAHCHLKNRAGFRSACARLGGFLKAAPSDYVLELIRFEVPRFAEEISEDPRQVAAWFGIDAA